MEYSCGFLQEFTFVESNRKISEEMDMAFEAGRRLSKTMKNQFVGFVNYRTGNSHKLETMKLDRRESRSKHT